MSDYFSVHKMTDLGPDPAGFYWSSLFSSFVLSKVPIGADNSLHEFGSLDEAHAAIKAFRTGPSATNDRLAIVHTVVVKEIIEEL